MMGYMAGSGIHIGLFALFALTSSLTQDEQLFSSLFNNRGTARVHEIASSCPQCTLGNSNNFSGALLGEGKDGEWRHVALSVNHIELS